MPDLPSIHTGLVLALALLALILFSTGKVRLETAAMLILVSLLIVFDAQPYHLESSSTFRAVSLLSAFGNEALIAVCALMILGKGIETTSALQPLVATAARHWSKRPSIIMLGVLTVAAILSAFLNNTPIVVVLLPVLISIAKKNRTSASKLLMPVGLVTIIGGMATTIGTSTNLLVVTMSADIANINFEMFDFAHYVVIAGGAGIIYLWLVAPLIIPKVAETSPAEPRREFIATMHINAGSPLVGKTISDFLERSGRVLSIDRIQQGNETLRLPLPSVVLGVDDRLFVRGTREDLKEVEHVLKAPLDHVTQENAKNPATEPTLAEILITERSELDGETLEHFEINERYGVVPVALHRTAPDTRIARGPLKKMRLRSGDILLCEGSKTQLAKLAAETSLFISNEVTDLPFTRRSTMAIVIMVGVVFLAANDILPIAISALLGVVLMVLTHCMGWRHVGEALSAEVILIIVVSLALGQALIVTGGDGYLASVFNHVMSGYSAAAVLAGLMLFMAVLTNVVSNNAAAVIGTPVAVQIAAQLVTPPEPFILAVLFGANLSFATPIGYQTNLLVATAGGYRFGDFVKVGGPLTLIMWAILSWLLIDNYGLFGTP